MENHLVFLCPFWLLFQVGFLLPIFSAKSEPCLLEGKIGQIPDGNQACTFVHSKSLLKGWKDSSLLGFVYLVQAGNRIRGQKRWWCCFWTLLRKTTAHNWLKLTLLHNLPASARPTLEIKSEFTVKPVNRDYQFQWPK